MFIYIYNTQIRPLLQTISINLNFKHLYDTLMRSLFCFLFPESAPPNVYYRHPTTQHYTASPRAWKKRASMLWNSSFFLALLVSRFRKVGEPLHSGDQYSGNIKPPYLDLHAKIHRSNPFQASSSLCFALICTHFPAGQGIRKYRFYVYTHRSCDTTILTFYTFTVPQSASTKLQLFKKTTLWSNLMILFFSPFVSIIHLYVIYSGTTPPVPLAR